MLCDKCFVGLRTVERTLGGGILKEGEELSEREREGFSRVKKIVEGLASILGGQ